MPLQATLESSRKAAVPGKPTSEDLGGQLAFAQSAQATFEVSCLTCTVFMYFAAFNRMPFIPDQPAHPMRYLHCAMPYMMRSVLWQN